MLSNYFTHRATFSLNVTCCYDVARNAATAAIGFSVRTVRAYIRACDIFFNVTLPSITLVKTVWHSKMSPVQYGISQLASHQCSRALADCFRLSRRHLDCRDVIKKCGQLWSQEQPYMKFSASFPKIYRFQQAKPIRKLTIQIGLACWNWKI